MGGAKGGHDGSDESNEEKHGRQREARELEGVRLDMQGHEQAS